MVVRSIRRAESVAVLGGGVAGLSAAQELVERGFEVSVYEARSSLGGKARSQWVADTARGGRRDLPGEHGFRFFPAFYRHVVDTMARIPTGAGTSVADNLRPAGEAGVALADDQPVARFLRRMPANAGDFADTLLLTFVTLGFAQRDVLLFSERILRYYTSCSRRRLEQYEGTTWWDFLGGDRYSEVFQRHLAAVPRTMVAMDSRLGNARTIGDVSLQLLADYGVDGSDVDRVLNGPTSDQWIEPWRRYLQDWGVTFHLDSPISRLNMDGARISSVDIAGVTEPIRADHFVLALPVEAARRLVSPEVAAADPSLARLREMPQKRFDSLTNWMNGVQLYLRHDVPIIPGHLMFPDAPWAMTAISQPQFWKDGGAFADRFGDGTVHGLISIDLSDWSTPGTFVRKCARDCTPEELIAEVWQQLKAGVNSRGGELLRDADLVAYHIDDELVPKPGGGYENRTPLLVHPPGSWADRPEAATRIENLVIAADYVRTHTDIASMEGANEAARRAVNAILDRSRSSAAPCDVWTLSEPAVFRRARELDETLYASRLTGRRHAFDLLPVQSARELASVAQSTVSGTLGGRLGKPRAA
jgi:uncharacterized protein with NAD-binding domain and iron-sulfur cluster